MRERTGSIDYATILASSVHDMKNSLTMVLSSLDELVESLADSGTPEQEGLARLRYETKRVNSNLIQLLTLYRLGQGHYPVNQSEQWMADYLQEVAFEHAAQLAAVSITLNIHANDGLVGYFDRDLILSVINNIINNTIRYSRERIDIGVMEQDGWLVIRIEDDGNGFPASMLNERYDDMGSYTPKHGGTGLGLFFAAQVAKAHTNGERCGFIRLSNGCSLGGGCFELYLP